MTEPPPRGSGARFVDGFGTRSLLTVDAEEEFDWTGPFSRTGHGVTHRLSIGRFQQFCDGLAVTPVYLVDWPIATSPDAAEIIGDAVRGGRAEVGIQLHPWVNPPLEEAVSVRNSFAGNLPEALERAKLMRLRDQIAKTFGVEPMIYRAGRYGLGPNTRQILIDAGVAIDSSVRSLYDYSEDGGPDYTAHPQTPYWHDPAHRLLELPLTTVYWGMLRRQGRWLYSAAAKVPHLPGVLSRAGLLEKIALTPEGVTADEALRGIDMALDDGFPLLVLSFHSPSLAVGHTPYVRSEEDLDRLYDWFRRVYAYLAMRGVKPTSVGEIMRSVEV